MEEHVKQDVHGHLRFQFSVPEMVGMVTGVVALSGAASLWMSLPHRVSAQEEAVRRHGELLRSMEVEFGARNEKVASLVATVESIDRRTQRIEQQISGIKP